MSYSDRILPGLKYADFAKAVGVPKSTIARWVIEEGLPATRRGTCWARIDLEAGQAWIKAHRLNSVAIRRKAVVYFATRASDNAIKIGMTSNLKRRLRDLRKEHKEEITLLASMPGDTKKEFSLHERFKTSRLDGEWFARTPELLGFLARFAG